MLVKNVRAYYAAGAGPEIKAVDGVSFAIREGEVLGIVGESGCGKSTLAAVMSLTARPPLNLKGGELSLDGQTIRLNEQTTAPPQWHGKMIALLPQRAMNSLNPTARVRDLVIDVVRSHHPTIQRQTIIEQAQERLDQLALPRRVLDDYPHQLSGGMRQRVVAVISTLLNPRVLIADEPTSALDVSSQKQLVLLLRLLLEYGFITRIVYITHDLPILSSIADRIAVMYAGKLVEIGDAGAIIDHPQHPYTQALIASTLDLGPHVREQQAQGIHGAPPDLRDPPGGCRFHPRCPYATERCSCEEPPIIGGDAHAVACWLTHEPIEQVSLQEVAP
jgi:peptide/nickel transport system ATP-binding protein